MRSEPIRRGTAREVFFAFLKLGLISFGGPIAHLGYFREELVARRKWVTESQYAELVALCQFLPGPASSQVGFGLGLVRGGYRGAMLAWVGFTLPSAMLLVAFAFGASLLNNPLGYGIITGLKTAAVAVVAHAVWGMAKTLTPDVRRIAIAVVAAAVVLMAQGAIWQVATILIGVLGGVLLCRREASRVGESLAVRVSRRAGIIALSVFTGLLVLLPVLAGFIHNLAVQTADAFYRAGALVFGGGHVVLPLLQAESVVAELVTPDQFLAGYGAAQAVPGPLFTFAAYLGAVMEPGIGGVLNAAVALIAVFLPGTLLLVGVLPFWGALQQHSIVRAGVRGANAAVVGILAAALYDPVFLSGITDWQTLGLAIGCFLLLVIWRVPPWIVVLVAAAGGVAITLV